MSDLTVNQVDVACLNVGVGDVLLVTPNKILSQEEGRWIHEAFMRAFERAGGTRPSILIGRPDIKVEICRSANAELPESVSGAAAA